MGRRRAAAEEQPAQEPVAEAAAPEETQPESAVNLSLDGFAVVEPSIVEGQPSATGTVTGPYAGTRNGKEMLPAQHISPDKVEWMRTLREDDPAAAVTLKSDVAPTLQDKLITAVGIEDDKESPEFGELRTATLCGSIWAPSFKESAMREMTVGIVRHSQVPAVVAVEGKQVICFRPLIDEMADYGFATPDDTVSDDEPWSIPLPWARTRITPTATEGRSMMACSFQLSGDITGGDKKLNIDIDVNALFAKTEAINAAIVGETDGVPQDVQDYVALLKFYAVALHLDLVNSLRVAAGMERQTVKGERELYRLVRVQLAEVYFGVAPIGEGRTREREYTTYHAQLLSLRDPKTAGGKYQSVSAARQTRGFNLGFAVEL